MILKKWILSAGLIGTLALPALAGNGSITTKDGKKFLNLTIFFNYAASAKDIAGWKANFRKANEILYRATLGQLQFGDIRFGLDRFTQARADIVIPVNGHAHVTGDGKGTNLGTTEQLFVYTAEDIDTPLVTVHELGHYVFGLWDEYQGTKFGLVDGAYKALGKAPDNSLFCVTKSKPNSALASIMWDNNDESIAHFCVAANHKVDIDVGNDQIVRSAQQTEEGRDCWSSIAEYAGLTAPDGPPNFDKKPPTEPNFKELGAEGLTVYLVQQTSGLTLQSTKLTVTDGIGRLRPPGAKRSFGDFAGVMTFNDNQIKTIVGIKEFRTLAERKAANTLVNAIPVSTVTTADTAAALRAAMTAMDAEEAQFQQGFASKTIVLFSDGRGLDGIDDDLIQELRRSNIGVHVSTLVPLQDDRLEKLAAKTLGKQAPALVRRPLAKVLGKVLDANSESNQNQEDVGAGSPGQFRLGAVQSQVVAGTPEVNTFVVDSFVNTLILQLEPVYDEESLSILPLDLEIRDPKGQLVDPASVSITEDETDGKCVRIEGVAPGSWTCRVSTTSDIPAAYSLMALGEGEPLLTGNGSQELKGLFPAATPLRVKLSTEQAITGAQVTGTVYRPDGTSLPVTFFDDGDQAHGDKLAGDGVYSALFSDYSGPGDYLVSVLASNSGSAQFSTLFRRGESLGFKPGVTAACPPFQRQLSLTFVCDANTVNGPGLLPMDDFVILSGAPGTVTLRWRNPNPGGTQTVIQRATKVGQWVDLITLPAQASEFTDTSAGNQGIAFYRLLAKGPQGLSQPTDFEQLDLAEVFKAFQNQSGGGAAVRGDNNGEGGFCFVATAAYGSFLDPHVAVLRRYRDQSLLPLPGGPRLVQAYYSASPALANFLVEHPWAKVPARGMLSVAVGAIEYPWTASALVLGAGLEVLRRRRRRLLGTNESGDGFAVTAP